MHLFDDQFIFFDFIKEIYSNYYDVIFGYFKAYLNQNNCFIYLSLQFNCFNHKNYLDSVFWQNLTI